VATWNPVPNGDVSLSGWTEEGGGSAPIYDQVDELIGSADDTGVKGTLETALTLRFTLSAPPGDLADGSVTAVTLQNRHKQSGRVDDTWTGAGTMQLLASDNTDLTNTMTITTSNQYSTSYLNSNAISATGVLTTGTAAQWADAELRYIDPVKSANMAADTVTWFIDAFDIVVTYTPAGTTANAGVASATATGQAPSASINVNAGVA